MVCATVELPSFQNLERQMSHVQHLTPWNPSAPSNQTLPVRAVSCKQTQIGETAVLEHMIDSLRQRSTPRFASGILQMGLARGRNKAEKSPWAWGCSWLRDSNGSSISPNQSRMQILVFTRLLLLWSWVVTHHALSTESRAPTCTRAAMCSWRMEATRAATIP